VFLALAIALVPAPPARAAALVATVGLYEWVVPATVWTVTWAVRFMEFGDWVAEKIKADTDRSRQHGEGRPEVAPAPVLDAPLPDSTPPTVRRKATRAVTTPHAVRASIAQPLYVLAATEGGEGGYEPWWHQQLELLWQRLRRLIQEIVDALGGGDAPVNTPPDPQIDNGSAPSPRDVT
jgi:hypothetical protein